MFARVSFALSVCAALPLAACASTAARPPEHARVSAAPPARVASSPVSPERATPAPAPSAPAEPTAPKPLHVTQLALGGPASFAVLSDGSLLNWGGSDGVGKLALDGNMMHRTPVRVPGLTGVTDVATSGVIACARTKDGSFCWGRDIEGDHDPKGQYMGSSYTPRHVTGLDDATAISVSYRSWCGIVHGVATCAPGALGAQAVSRGGSLFNDWACAVKTNGTVGCWGMFIGNEWAYSCCDEGNGLHYLEHRGVDEVAGLRDTQRLRVSDGGHACAIANGGTLYCWGFGESGQLGNGKYGAPYAELQPQRVKDIEGIEDVVVGVRFTCALKHGGTVACWGANGVGQLGVGDTRQRIVPTDVPGLSHVVELQAGGGHTCARTAEGEVWCWGANTFGQLGNGKLDTVGANPRPERIAIPGVATTST